MRACIELAEQSVRDNPTVTIHTLVPDRTQTDVEDFRALCVRHIPNMLFGRITSVRICCWRRRDRDRHDFHARYLLTDRGGYALDKGLDEERGVEQPVGLLDDQECQRLREGYSSANPFFEKADAFTLDKSGKLRPELPRVQSTKRPQ